MLKYHKRCLDEQADKAASCDVDSKRQQRALACRCVWHQYLYIQVDADVHTKQLKFWSTRCSQNEHATQHTVCNLAIDDNRRLREANDLWTASIEPAIAAPSLEPAPALKRTPFISQSKARTGARVKELIARLII